MFLICGSIEAQACGGELVVVAFSDNQVLLAAAADGDAAAAAAADADADAVTVDKERCSSRTKS